jgi:hypothetical protein
MERSTSHHTVADTHSTEDQHGQAQAKQGTTPAIDDGLDPPIGKRLDLAISPTDAGDTEGTLAGAGELLAHLIVALRVAFVAVPATELDHGYLWG